MKTKAAVCRAFGSPLTIETIELAEPGPGEVMIKTAACAICHSDISYVEGAWGGELPAVYGHEAAGVIEAVGESVTRLKVGDHVVATLVRNCGFCPACTEGAPVFCEEVFPLDRLSPLKDGKGKPIVHGLRMGGFAAHMVVDQSQAIAITKELPLDSASLIACGVLTGLGAVVNTAGVKAGSSVVVIGCGGVGLNSIQGARLAGASPIIAVDIEPAKLAAAREFGATKTINAKSEDVVERAAALNGGRKADWVFVSVGVKGAAEQGVSLMKRNGATVLVGMPPSGVMATIDPGWLAADGQRILGLQDGLGPARDRRADDRQALSRGAPQARPIDQRPLSARVDQRGPRLLTLRRGGAQRHRVLSDSRKSAAPPADRRTITRRMIASKGKAISL